MTLFNIALKNVKRNFKNYFLYFISMIFAIMIYDTFTSIRYNKEVDALIGSSGSIGSAFIAASVIIAIFAAMFIWYSNSFFTKNRKKEIALYSMLGVKKRQIGRMMFYENLAMGILALTIGIILGSLLSKVFIMLLVTLMGFSGNVKFAIIPKAIYNTVITFFILFLITSIHSYKIVYRFKLIDLFNASSKGEKEPKGSIIFAVLSLLLIGGGYAFYTKYFNALSIPVTLITVVIGTYFFFSSFTVFIIKLSRKNKNQYYKGINMIGTSQLLHRIKSSSRSLATIAVLSATTLTTMGFSASVYYDFKTNQDRFFPFSYTFAIPNKQTETNLDTIISGYPNNKVLNTVEVEGLKFKGKLPNIDKSNYGFVKNSIQTLNIVSESDFKKILKARNINENFVLNNSKEVILFDQYFNKRVFNSYKNTDLTIEFGQEKVNFKISDFRDYPLLNQNTYSYAVIVKDDVFKKYYDSNNSIIVKAYKVDNEKNCAALDNKLSIEQKSELQKNYYTSYYNNYTVNLSMYGLMIFISCFLGLVFLAATGSIIFFKQLSEATEDKERYILLKKLGVNKKEIKASISKQILIIFLTPLLMGAMHSIVAVSLLGKIFTSNLAIPVAVSIGAYTLIYMIYYFVTVNSYTKIAYKDS